MRRFDVALAELRTEVFQRLGLLLGKSDGPFRDSLFQPQQPFVPGQ